MSQSVTTAVDDKELEYYEHSDLTRMITDESGAVDARVIANTFKGYGDYVKNAVLLNGATAADDVIQLGSQLRTEVLQIMNSCGPTFYFLVINVFPLDIALEACRQEAVAYQDEVNTLKVKTAAKPQQPTTSSEDSLQLDLLTMERDMDAAHFAAMEKLEEDLKAQGTSTRLSAEKAADELASAIAAATRKHEREKSLAKADLNIEFMKSKASRNATYEKQCVEFNEDLQALEQLRTDMERKNSEAAQLNGYRALSNQLGLKIKNRILQFPKLLEDMGSNVTPTTTQIEIVDIMCGPSLSGIYHVLWQKYRKPSTAQFSTAALKLLNYRLPQSDALSNPLLAVYEIEAQWVLWNRAHFHELLTVDVLFSIALANSFPTGSAPRIKAMTALSKAIEKHANGDAEMQTGSTPILLFLKNALKTYALALRAAPSDEPVLKQSSTNSSSGQSQQKKGGYVPRMYPPKGNAETAAAAATTDRYIMISSSTPLFLGEVTRDRSFGVQSADGRIFPYVARKSAQEVCPECFGPGKKGHCGCNATKSYCPKCRMFGHREAECHQQVQAGTTKSS